MTTLIVGNDKFNVKEYNVKGNIVVVYDDGTTQIFINCEEVFLNINKIRSFSIEREV